MTAKGEWKKKAPGDRRVLVGRVRACLSPKSGRLLGFNRTFFFKPKASCDCAGLRLSCHRAEIVVSRTLEPVNTRFPGPFNKPRKPPVCV